MLGIGLQMSMLENILVEPESTFRHPVPTAVDSRLTWSEHSGCPKHLCRISALEAEAS
jgi:hypothetical protein